MTTAESIHAARLALIREHPDDCPELTGEPTYLLHPPSRFGRTSSWVRFRDKTLLPMRETHPDDPNIPRFLELVEAILAWRATIPAELRFWRPDEPTAEGAS